MVTSRRESYLMLLLLIVCTLISYYLVNSSNSYLYCLVDYQENGELIGNLFTPIISFVFISVGFALVWELYSKQKTIDYIINVMTRVESLNDTGLLSAIPGSGFKKTINWDKYFNEVVELELFVIYASNWRDLNRNNLESFSKRENTLAKIYLPDYEDDKLVQQLSNQFDWNVDKIKDRIKESIRDFDKYLNNKGSKCNVDIRLTTVMPFYSYYVFDHIRILALRNHSKEKIPGVPSFLFDHKGTLSSFLDKEREYLLKKSRSLTPDNLKNLKQED